jgi:hypothetical protein
MTASKSDASSSYASVHDVKVAAGRQERQPFVAERCSEARMVGWRSDDVSS